MEPKRLESPPDAVLAARDSHVEALLIDGLDHYFARRYDAAINVWTRVLFLDRSHARARAYIERARTAMAERQRRAEELLEIGHSLINEGRAEQARDVLAEAVATTGDDERASALRLRLERVERAQGTAVPALPAATAGVSIVPGWTWRRHRYGLLVVASLVGTSAVILTGWLALPTVRELAGLTGPRVDALRSTSTAPLPVLSSADVALVRARALYARGRLAEALRALDRVGAESPSRAAADTLRVEIQRLLLAGGRDSFRAPAGGGS
ncbi:MAG TPA: hypothetical protein VMM93_15155 [Vicinamibacterales bacterium]|nr:hypothetical protein [Vicinamibacterales bacterium]